MKISYLYVGVLEQCDNMHKGVSKGWCKESSLIAYMVSFSFFTKYVHMLMTWSFHIVDKVKVIEKQCTETGAIKRQIPLLKPKLVQGQVRFCFLSVA